MDIDNLTKVQMVLLVLLVSFVTSFVTGIVTVALIEQAPPPITQTIQKVVERVKELPMQAKIAPESSNKTGEVSGKTIVITQEEQIIKIVTEHSPAVVSIVATGTSPILSGTGFFVSKDGFLLTSHNIVEDDEAVYSIVLEDGRSSPARVVVSDPAHDLVILKVDGSIFSYVPLGDSDQLKIGQTVVAISNEPEDSRKTISVGIISGFKLNIVVSGLELEPEESYQVIETNAAANHGNLGGPLLDIAGNAIGINVRMKDGAENNGFALPINLAKKALAEINEIKVKSEEKPAS